MWNFKYFGFDMVEALQDLDFAVLNEMGIVHGHQGIIIRQLEESIVAKLTTIPV